MTKLIQKIDCAASKKKKIDIENIIWMYIITEVRIVPTYIITIK